MSPGDFALSVDELRVVAGHVCAVAEELLPVYAAVHPQDARPLAAIDAARQFVGGAPRGRLQRVAAMDAHRAAADAAGESARLAAQAAGDAASAAYLHPIAKAHQVGHILRADANAVRIAEIASGDDPAAVGRALQRAVHRAPAELIDVLRRYPPAPPGSGRVPRLMSQLDSLLRSR